LIYLQDIMTPADKTLHGDAKLLDAVNIMKKSKWNTIPVTDDKGYLIGVFTRSHLYQMVLDGMTLDDPIFGYMNQDVVALPLDTPYDVVEKIVKESKVGTGIVVDAQNKVIGLFTKTDMIAALFRSTQTLKEQLETILETSELGAILTDEEQKVLFVNHHLVRMLGKEAEEVFGQPVDQVIDVKKDHEGKFLSPQRIKIKHVQTVVRFSTYQTVKGKSGWLGLFQNVSEIEQLAEELETVKKLKGLLDTAIENAYDGIVMVNDQRKITFISPSMMELFSLEREQALGRDIQEVLPQLDLPKVMETGTADLSDLMEINGIRYIVQRIPVLQDDKLIGGIGKVMFRQLQEVKELFKKLEMMSNKVEYYQQELKKVESSRFTMEQIITGNEAMEKIKRIAFKAAKGRSTILIRGESGTGKELFAHAIHSVSARKDGPFVTVNCAAIPDHLLESEFFGYEEGAFTGAKQQGKIGKFDLADGGTLFLDEIADMSTQLQAKLLRVLQEKAFYRVGGTEKIRVDVRIIAATNRSLEKMVEEGTFREDLYYRLNVISMEIPPLRKRKSDIMLLSEMFIQEMNKLIGASITGMEEDAKQAMLQYDWPGNVRELKNVIERAVTFSEYGKIKRKDLPDYLKDKLIAADQETSDQNLLAIAEQQAIEQALTQAMGNKTKAAEILGISRSVLYSKLKKHGH